MRGENGCWGPPRHPRHRNIPACAGKTVYLVFPIKAYSEHPRVRGENDIPATDRKRAVGTSPRARGKPSGLGLSPHRARNIPACAGKTYERLRISLRYTEHPRVRGENGTHARLVHWKSGTSPRARGKPRMHFRLANYRGNIPACAGKTFFVFSLAVDSTEHPRVRGENVRSCTQLVYRAGTSPRARGKLWLGQFRHSYGRNIPACAGKTQRYLAHG